MARRILVAMSLMALAPLLVMAMQGLHCAHQAVVEITERNMQSILAARKAQLESWLDEREKDLRLSCFMACQFPGCTGLLNHMTPEHFESIGDTIDLFELEEPIYESVAIYDAEWNRIGAKSDGTHHDDQDLLDGALRDQLSVSSGIVASASHPHEEGGLGLHMGYPLRSEGVTAGFIVVNISLADTLNRVLKDRAGLGESGSLHLVSSSGEYITSPSDGHSLIGQDAGMPETMLNSDNGVYSYRNSSGARMLGSSSPIDRFNWILVAEVSEAEALGWLKVLTERALITGTVTFLVVIVLAFRFSQSMSQPFRVLAHTARKIAKGSHTKRVQPLRGNEAQEVAQAFNEMLDALSAAQQQVIQSAALAAVGELSARVVHEMRNPLSSIKINLQALKKKVEGDENYSELADIASGQALRLEQMLSELLSYGKQVTINQAATSFRRITEQAKSVVQPSATERNIDLVIGDNLGDKMLSVDRELIQRVVVNLIQNAIDASPKGNSVLIEGRPDVNNDAYAEIRVLDDGTGIAEPILEQLFQPFVTTKDEGTGLGLANVKKIVELHGGTVFASNRPEGGAIFTVQIPLAMVNS